MPLLSPFSFFSKFRYGSLEEISAPDLSWLQNKSGAVTLYSKVVPIAVLIVAVIPNDMSCIKLILIRNYLAATLRTVGYWLHQAI
jgi:hypothetical protein